MINLLRFTRYRWRPLFVFLFVCKLYQSFFYRSSSFLLYNLAQSFLGEGSPALAQSPTSIQKGISVLEYFVIQRNPPKQRQSLLELLLSTKLAITVQRNYAVGNPRRYFAKCEWVKQQMSVQESERVPVEADPRGFMSKCLKAALVLNRQSLDSLSHSYTPTD